MRSDFYKATSIEQALQLAAELGPGACFLAGGSELNNQASTIEATAHILITPLGLDRITVVGDTVEIGATVPIQRLIDAPEVPAPLRRAAAHIGNRNVRNVATVGGHIATNKPWADLLPTLVVLDATAEVHSLGGPTTVSVEQLLATGVAGLITKVVVPKPSPGRHVAVGCYTRTANDVSVVNAAVALSVKEGRVEAPAVAAGGIAPHVIRLTHVEAALAGRLLPALDAIEKITGERLTPVGDVRGTAAFKRHMASVLVARAAHEAWAAASREG